MNKKEEITNKYSKIIEKGIFYAKKGNHKLAINCFSDAISIDRLNHEAYINLSNIYFINKDIKKGIELLFSYLENNKFHNEVARYLCRICLHYKKEDEFKKLLKLSRKAVLSDVNISYIYYIEGQFFENNKNIKNAILSYKKSIKLNSEFGNTYEKLLNLLENTNDLIDLNYYIKIGEKNISSTKNNFIIILYKSILFTREKKFSESSNLLKSNKIITKVKGNKNLYLKALDILIKNNEGLKKYKEALLYVDKKNRYLKNLKDHSVFDKEIIFNLIEKYKLFYNYNNVKKINDKLNYEQTTKLVFLVGFPRSGTTLLDTILRTHTQISVLEEKPYLLDIRHEFFKSKNNQLNSISNITQNEKDMMVKNYFKNIENQLNKDTRVIIDKLPLSIIEIGFIKSIFPNSSFILALRHPCDVIISCYFNSFKINDAMVNFLDWDDTINLYNKVFELFDFYNNELNLNLYKIKYENIVKNFKNEIRLLLSFLNLEYEKKLEKFYITAQKRDKISTPSYTQVINPLYRSSINRWKNFAHYRTPEKKLQKWIKKLNY